MVPFPKEFFFGPLSTSFALRALPSPSHPSLALGPPLLCSRSIKTANVAADTALRKKILIVYEGSHFKSKKMLHIKWMELAKTKSFFPKKSCFKSKIRDKNEFTP